MPKNAITPAGISYDRAFEIALAVVDKEGPHEPGRYDKEIQRLHAEGFTDTKIAMTLDIPRPTVRVRRTHLGLETQRQLGIVGIVH